MDGARVTNTARPFTILDGMILIGATAVGLAVIQALGTDQVTNLNRTYPALHWLGVGTMRAVEFSPIPATWSLALLGMTLRGTRPRLRRLARCPGFVASGAVVVTLVLGMPILAPVTAGLGLVRNRFGMIETMELVFGLQVGIGVATSWMLLKLGGLWRVEPHWRERAGHVLGCFWIALTQALGFLFITDSL